MSSSRPADRQSTNYLPAILDRTYEAASVHLLIVFGWREPSLCIPNIAYHTVLVNPAKNLSIPLSFATNSPALLPGRGLIPKHRSLKRGSITATVRSILVNARPVPATVGRRATAADGSACYGEYWCRWTEACMSGWKVEAAANPAPSGTDSRTWMTSGRIAKS